jgi:hypothetical protein
VHVVMRGEAVDEEAEGGEEAAQEHGGDAPFWGAFFELVFGFEVGVELGIVISFLYLFRWMQR